LELKKPALRNDCGLFSRIIISQGDKMIVPEFWADAKRTCEANGRKLTLKRFGWSDVDMESAQHHAEARLAEAIKNFESGAKPRKSEPKIAYNGADGVPIREEIISRHGDTIITRNGYGALCLNTPNVLFGDIDFVHEASFKTSLIAFGVLLTASLGLIFGAGFSKFTFLILLATPTLSKILFSLFRKSFDTQQTNSIVDIKRFLSKHPDWHLRIYKTPMGLRVLVLHATFNPQAEDVKEFFRALNVDTIYQRMCLNQNCFRARVSPKPWRIGIEKHMRPRPGVWPINPDKLHLRKAWVTEYDLKALGFSSCHYIEEIGSQNIDPTALAVQKIHDEYCRVNSDLPIA
jgi:hypothetical protein